MYNFTKNELDNLYTNLKMNPYEIAAKYNCNHKTIRAWLTKFEIKRREASEYNYLPRMTFAEPTNQQLFTPLSIAAHTMYICEGWHTEKTNCLMFVNQDTALIKTFTKCILETYRYASPIRYNIKYNKSCQPSCNKALDYESILQATDVKIFHCNDISRKNPIICTQIGGKNMARCFISNCYKILSSI